VFCQNRPWFNDEGVQLAAREWISTAGDKFTAYRLTTAIGEYLDSQRATEAVDACFGPGGIGSEHEGGFTLWQSSQRCIYRWT